MVFLVGGANSASDFEIENSCRFNDGDAPVLSRDPSTEGDRRTFTISAWVKLSNPGNVDEGIFNSNVDSAGNRFAFGITSAGHLNIYNRTGGTTYALSSTAKLRDPSAWYHCHCVIDTTDGTEADRQRLYLNGTRITSFTDNTPVDTQNVETAVNRDDTKHAVGDKQWETAHFDGYIAEHHFLDGAAKEPTDFGETDDNGVWVPKKYTGGSYGTNGHFLEFKETGTSANASGIGADTSGTGNHYTVSNLAAQDITTDTPTNNFATLNPLITPFSQTNYTLSEGNCKYVTGLNQPAGVSTMAMTNGKWYWEIKKGSTVDNPAFGIVGANYGGIQGGTDYGDADSTVIQTNKTGEEGDRIGYYDDVYKNSTDLNYGSFDAIESGDIFMVALDMDNNKIWFGNNGTWLGSGDPAAGSNNVTTITSGSSQLAAVDSPAGTNVDWEINFGNPSFSISSGNADANGYGNFEYAVPSGFYALCTKNLGEYG